VLNFGFLSALALTEVFAISNNFKNALLGILKLPNTSKIVNPPFLDKK
jgi:hypothetical protein